MIASEIQRLVVGGETANVEFKRTLADARKIIETIAAIATSGGGHVLIGIRDDGRVIGVDLGRGEIERFAQQVLSATDPRLYVSLDVTEFEGHPVLIVRVPPGDGPHLAFGRAFLRVGPSTVAMTRDQYERRLLDRVRESSGFERWSHDDWTADLLSDVAIDAFVERARAVRGTELGPRGGVIARLDLWNGARPTVGTLLLFGREPQRGLPQSTVHVRDVRGVQIVAETIEGTLFHQIERTVSFVGSRLGRVVERRALRRTETPELPIAAVREVIVNAVAHRDYRSTAPVQVVLEDAGLSVWNAGHLPAPLTPEALRREHPSVPPNPRLARALFMTGYIEQWGSGTLRVIQAMASNGNQPPTFEDVATAAGVRAYLPLLGRLPLGLSARQVEALNGLGEQNRFTTVEYAGVVAVSKRTALDDLRQLENAGFIKRVGVGRASAWERT